MATRKIQKLCCVKGRYQRTLGKFFNTKKKVAPKKFLLGTDRDQAERANLRLEQLWRDIEQRYRDEPLTHPRSDEPVWGDLTLHMAEAIRKGLRITFSEEELSDLSYGHQGEALALWFQWVRTTYASIGDLIDTPDCATFRKSQETAGAHAKIFAELAQLRALAAEEPAAAAAPGQTLHLALEAWEEHIRELKTNKDGVLIEGGRKIMEAARRFRENHTDIPLAELNYKGVCGIVSFWRSRPPSKANTKERGKPLSATTVKNHIGYFRRFLEWLHRAEDFAWRDDDRIIADAFARNQTTVILTPEEIKKSCQGPEFWTVEELTTLYAAASHRERLYMLLGLNAGYAHSEIVHLLKEEVHFENDPPDIRAARNKRPKPAVTTLWPETINALQWVQQQADTRGYSNSQWAVLSEKGRQMSRQPIANTWNRLLDRVQLQDPAFKRLSFKFLRKTNAVLLERCGADSEIIAIVHGRYNRSRFDGQADAYYPRMSGKVRPHMDALHEHLKPMFDAAGEQFGERQRFPRKRPNSKDLSDQATESPATKRSAA